MAQSTFTTTDAAYPTGPISLFPLPLAVFEEMLVTDDRDEYPMISCKELSFAGRLDPQLLRRAIRRSVARHPLLTSTIRQDPQHGWLWEQGTRAAEVDWGSIEAPIEGVRRPVDLSRETGVKFWVRTGENSTRIAIRIHHACCDGFGALQLLEDLFSAYLAEQQGRTQPNWRPLQRELLRQRGDFANLRREKCEGSTSTQKLSSAFRFLMQEPTPLAAPGESSTSIGESFDGRSNHDLGAGMLKGLRRAAASSGATLNDVLLRDLFLAMRNWNLQHGGGAGKWLRILMPCNLRESDTQDMPAANRMGYSFLTRSVDECARPGELLQGISIETKEIREQRRYLQWTRGLELVKSTGYGISWLTRASRCFCTVVLSNLGDPMRVFSNPELRQRGKLQLREATLESIAAYTPLRPNTHAGFLITTYAGRLGVSLISDPNLFTQQTSSQLFDVFQSALSNTANIQRT